MGNGKSNGLHIAADYNQRGWPQKINKLEEKIMMIDETLKKFKSEGNPQVVLDALEQLKQESEDAWRVASDAHKAYFADADEKKEKVDARIADLTKQRDQLQAKIETFKQPLVKATASGDSKKLAEIKNSMKDIEAERSQVSEEIGLLQSAHISGEPELYETALKKAEEFCSKRESYWAAKDKVHSFALEMINVYENISKNVQRLSYNGRHSGGGYDIPVDELKRHFHYEEYAKAEELAAKEKADREAEAEKSQHTQICDGERRIVQII